MEKHFISFPKSGRTWVRYILRCAHCDTEIKFHHDGFEYNDGSKPTLDFNFEWRIKKYSENCRIVYLDRDPRDIMVSLFYQITGRFGDIFEYRGTISEFIRDKYFGAQNLKRFRDMWFQLAKATDTLVVTYETIHSDAFTAIEKIVDHFEINPKKEDLKRSVEMGSFKKMEEIEHSGLFSEPWLRPRNGKMKIRKGLVGNFRQELSKEDQEYLNKIFEKK